MIQFEGFGSCGFCFMVMVVFCCLQSSSGFVISRLSHISITHPHPLQMQHSLASVFEISRSIGSLVLSDTSLSEEDVLDVVGQTADLPDPLLIIGLALALVLGVGLLQFSLGDLTKEEGQARVRDFLQTRRDTERKRGYFDD